jgi:hypothetical protein
VSPSAGLRLSPTLRSLPRAEATVGCHQSAATAPHRRAPWPSPPIGLGHGSRGASRHAPSGGEGTGDAEPGWRRRTAPRTRTGGERTPVRGATGPAPRRRWHGRRRLRRQPAGGKAEGGAPQPNPPPGDPDPAKGRPTGPTRRRPVVTPRSAADKAEGGAPRPDPARGDPDPAKGRLAGP